MNRLVLALGVLAAVPTGARAQVIYPNPTVPPAPVTLDPGAPPATAAPVAPGSRFVGASGPVGLG